MGRIEIDAWRMRSPSEDLVRARVVRDGLGAEEVLIDVAGCGVCHTDLGFLFGGVRPGRPLPLTLGHEIAGRVIDAGGAARSMIGRAVIVPAVLPCGTCALCRAGRGSICRAQTFVGSDIDGGFASRVIVPSRGLCAVDEKRLAARDLALADLAVLADAVTTPFQAILRSGLAARDVAIFIGAGGVGGFGVQIARAKGAHVVAIDVDEERLALIRGYGPHLSLDARALDARGIRQAIAREVEQEGLNPHQWKIFETSGNPKGQELAFSLLNYGATLSVVGYTLEKVTIRLSNLMAFDAAAIGNWGCLPEHYPAALDLVLDGSVKLKPFIDCRPMSRINETLHQIQDGKVKRRPVLIPDFAR
jgi:6-hydroxycyclohex-1-ene-1-carbonyl-CoA dehydrogenase